MIQPSERKSIDLAHQTWPHWTFELFNKVNLETCDRTKIEMGP